MGIHDPKLLCKVRPVLYLVEHHFPYPLSVVEGCEPGHDKQVLQNMQIAASAASGKLMACFFANESLSGRYGI